MTIWLWIIGITALVWPVIVAHMLENQQFKNIELDFTNHNRTEHVVLSNRFATVHNKISDTRKFIEQQDELIAILWHKVYGYRPDDDDHLIYSWENYPNEVFGKAPGWTTTCYQEEIGDNRIKRNHPFPWDRA